MPAAQSKYVRKGFLKKASVILIITLAKPNYTPAVNRQPSFRRGDLWSFYCPQSSFHHSLCYAAISRGQFFFLCKSSFPCEMFFLMFTMCQFLNVECGGGRAWETSRKSSEHSMTLFKHFTKNNTENRHFRAKYFSSCRGAFFARSLHCDFPGGNISEIKMQTWFWFNKYICRKNLSDFRATSILDVKSYV